MRVLLPLIAAVAISSPVLAEPAPTTVALVLKDHQFSPSSLTVPAGQRIRIELRNQDGTADEFDSDDLHVEKEIAPHGRAVIEVGPLKPGTYRFVGELHAKTAMGTLTATAP